MSEQNEIRVGLLPSTFLKWGRLIIVLVFVAMVGILLGLRTTKVISGPISITSVSEPHDLFAQKAGTFHTEVSDGESVDAMERIGYIEGNYHPEQVTELKRRLGDLKIDSVLGEPARVVASSDRFGALQGGPLLDAYTAFVGACDALDQIQTIEQEKVERDLASLRRQIGILKEQLAVARKSDSLLRERSHVQSDVFRRTEILLHDSVIARGERDREYLDRLESDYEYILNQTEIPEIENDIEAVRKQIATVQYEHEVRKSEYRRTVRLSYRELYQLLEDWVYEHIIRSPIPGECVLSRLEPRYEVIPQQVVAKIIPADSAALIGRFKAPPQGISKIKIGAPVRVKLDAYPYLEFGAVFGKIKSISKVPFRGQYNVSVEFPEGLKTNYDYKLEFSQTLEGRAEVILDKSNMLEKIIHVIKWQEKVY